MLLLRSLSLSFNRIFNELNLNTYNVKFSWNWGRLLRSTRRVRKLFSWSLWLKRSSELDRIRLLYTGLGLISIWIKLKIKGQKFAKKKVQLGKFWSKLLFSDKWCWKFMLWFFKLSPYLITKCFHLCKFVK